MEKKGNFVFYAEGDVYNYWLPMKCWEPITAYEDKDISIQFNIYRTSDWIKVIITHIESRVHWSWNFDKVLWDFKKEVLLQTKNKYKEDAEVVVVNVMNKWLLKYFKKHKIKAYEM